MAKRTISLTLLLFAISTSENKLLYTIKRKYHDVTTIIIIYNPRISMKYVFSGTSVYVIP